MNVTYNFRIGPEALFLILSAVGGAILSELVTTDYATITDWRAWGWAFVGMLLFRTIPAAILAVVTGGGFQRPGVTKEQDAVDEGLPRG